MRASAWYATSPCSPQETLSELQHIGQGSPEWAANASQVDQVLQYFSLDLGRYGIQRPELGPETERARLQQVGPAYSLSEGNGNLDSRVTTAPPRMPTLDVGLAPLLANVRALATMHRRVKLCWFRLKQWWECLPM